MGWWGLSIFSLIIDLNQGTNHNQIWSVGDYVDSISRRTGVGGAILSTLSFEVPSFGTFGRNFLVPFV